MKKSIIQLVALVILTCIGSVSFADRVASTIQITNYTYPVGGGAGYPIQVVDKQIPKNGFYADNFNLGDVWNFRTPKMVFTANNGFSSSGTITLTFANQPGSWCSVQLYYDMYFRLTDSSVANGGNGMTCSLHLGNYSRDASLTIGTM